MHTRVGTTAQSANVLTAHSAAAPKLNRVKTAAHLRGVTSNHVLKEQMTEKSPGQLLYESLNEQRGLVSHWETTPERNKEINAAAAAVVRQPLLDLIRELSDEIQALKIGINVPHSDGKRIFKLLARANAELEKSND